MSTVKRTVRPVKPKVQAPVVPVEAAPVVEATPVEVAPVDPTQVLAAASKRQQTSKAIGVSISSARVRRHLDKLNLNVNVDAMIGEFKKQLSAYKAANAALETNTFTWTEEKEVELDGKKQKQSETKTRELTDAEKLEHQGTVDRLSPAVAMLEMKVTALSRERTRFSNEAAIVLSIIADEFVQQLTEHTMNRVLANKKKIIQVGHLHEAGVEKLSLYPLFKTLPSFVATADKLAKDFQTESRANELSAKLAQAEKDFKKKYDIHLPRGKKVVEAPAVDAEVVEAEVVEDAEDTSDSKTSFRFYVGQVCKEIVKRDARYKAVRVSTEIRGYLSDLLVELIQRLSTLVQLTATCMKNKTINDVAILRTVEGLLIDGHQSVETLEFKDALIHDPVVLKAEAAKKEEEKAAGREYKIDLEKVPKVAGMVAVRTVTYPTSGFAALSAKVTEKLQLYADLSDKEKAAALNA